MSNVPSRSHSKTPSTVNNSLVEPKKAYTAHLITQLDIPSDFINHSDTSLYMGYKKYKCITAAIHAASGITWEVKKPTDTEIIEVFCGKIIILQESETLQTHFQLS